MDLPTFLIGRYFSSWEHEKLHFLCTADVEAYSLEELLGLADSQARDLWSHLRLGYTATQGDPLLRREIAALYKGVEPEEVITFAGGEEAIFVLFNVLLQPGDHVVVIWPAYQSLYSVPHAINAEITFVPLQPDKDWSLNKETLQAAIRPDTRALIINFPHAPTGALLDQALFAELCQMAQEVGAYIFSDESFRFLEYNPEDRLPAAVEQNERGISLGSMSKAFALAGLRVGWLATHDQQLIQGLLRFKDYTSVSNSAASEILSLIGLRSREAILSRSLAMLSSHLELLDHFFARWSQSFTWVRPRAGTIAFPCLTRTIPVEQVAKHLLELERVLILPGSVYEYPGQYFRIGFGHRDFSEVLSRFERYLTTHLA